MKFVFGLGYAIMGFTSLSALLNIILATLIVLRLLYHGRRIRNTLGLEHGSPYTKIITICVESSALMVIASGLYPILWALPAKASTTAQGFMININPHIYVGGLELNNF